MKHKLRSGTLVFSLLMIIIIMRRASTQPEVKIETRMTVIIMMKMNARKEKGTEVGRCGAEAPMRLKVEQIENKGPVCGRGEGGGGKVERGKGPEEEKRGVKRWTRGLKDSERLANPNEGTIAEVCTIP